MSAATPEGAYTIRALTSTELELWLDLRMRVLAEVFADTWPTLCPGEHARIRAANRAYIKGSLAFSQDLHLCAFSDGHPIACGDFCLQHELPSPDNPNGRCAYLMNIYTVPPWRGHGVGSALVRELVERARAAGAKDKIYLETSQAGRTVYTRLGFNDLKDMMRHEE
jgi:GNAT superfamily N-acetyltransferase